MIYFDIRVIEIKHFIIQLPTYSFVCYVSIKFRCILALFEFILQKEAGVSEEILKWHSHSLSLCAEL